MTQGGERITLTVGESGQRVDKFLAEHSLLSRSAIQRQDQCLLSVP